MIKLLSILIFGVLGSAFAGPILDNIDEGIVGGTAAAEGQYPYQITMKLRNTHRCGGSIISNDWILTAAHCVHGITTSGLTVVVGTNYVNSGGRSHPVAQIISHERFNPRMLINDIAVLRLSTPIQYTSTVQPINLATTATSSGITCNLSGWGLLRYPSNEMPNALQHITLKSIPLGQCKKGLLGFPLVPTDGNVCTLERSGRGACHGDSGGPLVCEGVQHGIVSWGDSCAKGRPDVFASVAHYRSWITSKTGV